MVQITYRDLTSERIVTIVLGHPEDEDIDQRRISILTPAGFALHLTTAIARPAARNERSARRVIAKPASKDVNQPTAPVVAG